MNSSDRVGSITVYAIGFNKKAAGYVRFILFFNPSDRGSLFGSIK